MTKAQAFMNPVSDVGVNYVDAEKGTDRDPDIIKTTPKVANGKPYNWRKWSTLSQQIRTLAIG